MHKILKRFINGFPQKTPQPGFKRQLLPFFPVSAVLIRLFGQQHGHNADQSAERHHNINFPPVEPGCQPQGKSAGKKHSQPVAQHKNGRAGALLRGFKTVNAVGVENNILRGRTAGNDQCQKRHPGGMFSRIDCRHCENSRQHAQLNEQCPAAAAPQTLKQRQPDAVDQRRPYPFEAVGHPRQRKKADQSIGNLTFLQPHRQRAADQKQRKTAGKAERQHYRHSPVGINFRGVQPFCKHRQTLPYLRFYSTDRLIFYIV